METIIHGNNRKNHIKSFTSHGECSKIFSHHKKTSMRKFLIKKQVCEIGEYREAHLQL